MPFPTTPILDNFNRANEGPPPSASWNLSASDGPGEGLAVSSNQLRAVAVGAGSGGAVWDTAYTANQEIYIDYVTSGGASDLFSLHWRRQNPDASGSGYNFQITRASNTWLVSNSVSGVIGSGSLTIAVGDSVGVSHIGSTIKLWHKPSAGIWTNFATITNNDINQTGYLHVYIDNSSMRLDNFGGGNEPGIVMPSFPPVPPSADPKKPGYVLTLQDPSGTIIGFITPDKTGVRRLPRGPGVERQTRRQTSIAGGRGADRYEEDTTRYNDSLNLWSMVEGQITPGPHFGPWRIVDIKQNRNVHPITKWTREDSTTTTGTGPFPKNAWAGKFTVPTGGYTSIGFSFLVRRKLPAITNAHRVSIYTDSAGVPGTLVSGGESNITMTELPDTIATWITFVQTVTLTAGTSYWFVVETTTPTVGFELEMILQDGGVGARRSTAGTWTTHTAAPMYYIKEVKTPFDIVKFFDYKSALYAVIHTEGAAESRLFLNGDRGVATGATQSTTVLQDTTKTWATNEWYGKVLFCISGPNISEGRVISANDANTITTEAFQFAHTTGATGDEYVILSSDKWEQLAITPNLTAVSKAAIVCNDIVYIAQGEGVAILRMREYNNAGVWTRESALDGSSVGTLLLSAPHWDTGEQSVYRWNVNTNTVSVAKKQSWGTNLTFETGIDSGNKGTIVRGMALYNNAVWIGKEDSVWVLKNGKFSQVPIAMEAARNLRNGVAITGWNTNLYYSFLAGLERLYGQVVDDIGPNRDLGMPAGRQGAITSVVSVLQYLFCSYDAGRSGTSSILATTSPGGDWHEVFRSIRKGARITSIHYQAIPELINRLWLHHGSDLFFLYQSDNIYFPSNDPNMVVTPESYWVTAWHDLGTPELDHYFHEIRVMLGSLQGKIRIEYKVDDDSNAWVAFTANVTTVPFSVLTIGNGLVTGRRIKFRFIIEDEGVTGATVVNSVELRGNTMNEVIYDYHIDLRLVDKIELMDGRQDYTTDAIEIINQLEAWKEVADPLTMRFAAPGGGTVFDSVKVHLDPVSLVIGEWNERNSKLTGNVVLKAIG